MNKTQEINLFFKDMGFAPIFWGAINGGFADPGGPTKSSHW